MNGAPLANHTTKYCLQTVARERRCRGVAHGCCWGSGVCCTNTHQTTHAAMATRLGLTSRGSPRNAQPHLKPSWHVRALLCRWLLRLLLE